MLLRAIFNPLLPRALFPLDSQATLYWSTQEHEPKLYLPKTSFGSYFS